MASTVFMVLFLTRGFAVGVSRSCSVCLRQRARVVRDQSKRSADQLLHQTLSGRVAARNSGGKLSVGPWLGSFSTREGCGLPAPYSVAMVTEAKAILAR